MLNRAFRTALCAGALLLALCLPASAAQEGDFSVLVNGEAVTFTDAAPLLKDGRSFLPMVETFDALGFAQGDITWDAATRSVTAAKDGTSITLTIDQKELTVTRGQEDAAETDTITTDAAPFIDAASSRHLRPRGTGGRCPGVQRRLGCPDFYCHHRRRRCHPGRQLRDLRHDGPVSGVHPGSDRRHLQGGGQSGQWRWSSPPS